MRSLSALGRQGDRTRLFLRFTLTPVVTVGEGNLWGIEYMINYGCKRVFTVSVTEFRDGKVSHWQDGGTLRRDR
jgi:hypothetical protein